MSLADLLAVFRAHWALLAGAMFFAMACAGVYLALVPSHYEATATVRLGELGRVGPELWGRLVEPDAEALARMRGPEFLAMVINALGWKDAKRVGLLTASYQVTNPEIGHLRVTVRGHTRNMHPGRLLRQWTRSSVSTGSCWRRSSPGGTGNWRG